MTAVPALRAGERVAMPVVVGVMKPAILIPASMMSSFSQVQLEAIVSHELAHVRRFDLLVNIIQRLIETVLFLHPAVWHLSRRISVERERCCDDLAVNSGFDSVTYADTLVRVAESCRSADRQQHLTALASTGASRSELKRRVLRLIDPRNVAEKERTGGGVVLCMSGLILTALLMSTLIDPATANAETNEDDTESTVTSRDATDDDSPDPVPGETGGGSDFLKKIRDASAPILLELAEMHNYRLEPERTVRRGAALLRFQQPG